MADFDALHKDLKVYCKTAIESMWGNMFDEWLFIDAGAAFNYAFDSRINKMNINSTKAYGKMCVYNIQLHVRKNANYTIETIMECVNQYLSKIITDLKGNVVNVETIHDYSYFS